MSLFHNQHADVLYFSMDDPDDKMSRSYLASFSLDGREWPTVEHYYQAMKFDNADDQAKIHGCASAAQAKKRGNARFKKKRADLKQVKTTLMTRAVYIQAKTHPIISDAILNTLKRKLVENSQFDYYWGCGRDQRGSNHFGEILMNVRQKLLDERDQTKTT